MRHDPATGRFTGPSKSPEERFWPRVNKTNSCWLWTGSLYKTGYGVFSIGNKHLKAHRFAYQLLKGPLVPGMELDHLCREPTCVNPDHLEQVSHQVNVKRGTAGAKIAETQRRKTHCPRGHPYNYVNPNSGQRFCLICIAAHKRRYRAQKRAAAP